MVGDFENVEGAIAAGADVNATDASGNSPLHWAAHHGHSEVAAALLKSGADPDRRHGTYGHAPMHSAKTLDITQMLLGADANPHLCDNHGASPVEWAARADRYEIVDLLGEAMSRDPRKLPTTLAGFVEALDPVEHYDNTQQAKFFGKFGCKLAQMWVFSHSGDESHQKIIEAMHAAYQS